MESEEATQSSPTAVCRMRFSAHRGPGTRKLPAVFDECICCEPSWLCVGYLEVLSNTIDETYYEFTETIDESDNDYLDNYNIVYLK